MTPSKKQKYLAILIVMITLGSAWAIRGRFGHEYGAAWAGSIGVLSIVIASGRRDWLQNWLPITAIGAIGWGVTGMISYGQVVGYGKSGDMLNTTYGLLSLFIIGGLFGFLGGGLTGLMMETSNQKKPDWARLITQMVAGGIIFWGFLIYQLEWLMTPPRSELWAACLGASFALGWYMHRHRFINSWYVALTTMLGAGFGFAFGNFLQTIGLNAEIDINWWNVMEYSIGFFGGLGMAFGVFSRPWPQMPRFSKASMMWSALLLFILIPLWTITNTFEYEKILHWAQLAGTSSIDQYSTGIYLQLGLTCLLAIIGLGILTRKTIRRSVSRYYVILAFFITWFWYQFLKLITSGIFSYYSLSLEELTVLNFIIVAILLLSQKSILKSFGPQTTNKNLQTTNIYNSRPGPFEIQINDQKIEKILLMTAILILVILILLSATASGVIDEMPGGNLRFGGK